MKKVALSLVLVMIGVGLTSPVCAETVTSDVVVRVAPSDVLVTCEGILIAYQGHLCVASSLEHTEMGILATLSSGDTITIEDTMAQNNFIRCPKCGKGWVHGSGGSCSECGWSCY